MRRSPIGGVVREGSRCKGVFHIRADQSWENLGKKIPGIGNCSLKGLWQERA